MAAVGEKLNDILGGILKTASEDQAVDLLPARTTPADLSRQLRVRERTLRTLARKLGACRAFSKKMILTPDDVARIIEASKCPTNSSSAANSGTTGEQLASRDHAVLLMQRKKATAQRIAVDIEARARRRHLDGDGAEVTFAQAAFGYRQAEKPSRFLDKIEDHWKDTLSRKISAGAIRQAAWTRYPKAKGRNLQSASDRSDRGNHQLRS